MVKSISKPVKTPKSRWVDRLDREKKAHESWRKQARRSEAAYRDEDREVGQRANVFPLWWSTVQITHAAIFAKAPKPDVRKRYSTGSKADDNIAQAIERAITLTIDTSGFEAHGNLAVDDYLVAAAGIAKVEMDTETQVSPVIDPVTLEPIVGEDGEPVTEKRIVRQALRLRHFHWSKFGWEPGKDWESCDWEYFIHDMSPEEIEERWKVDLGMTTNAEPKIGAGTRKPYKDTLEVYEIWDRKKKRRLFLCKEHDELLEDEPDPLKLSGFYPNPKPMFLNAGTKQMVPKPDYLFIESQCDNINRLTGRMQALAKQIKDVGFYDAALSELAKLKDAPDGTRVPITGLMERLDKASRADFENVMAVQDNTGRVQVLATLMQQRDTEKAVVFETLGISDIIRGATVASETAEAQKIKSQWNNVRIGPKMKAIAVFFRDVFRIMAELLGEHFEPAQLNAMTGMELTPQELAAMKDDLARTYAVDVETDSTLASDDAEEREQRLAVLKTMTDYLGVYLPMAQQNLIPAEMVKQLLLFAISGFKYGRELEDTIRQMPGSVEQLQKLAGDLQQCQQQLEQSTQQSQQLQAELQQVDQAENARKDMVANAEADLKSAEAEKVRMGEPPTLEKPGPDPLEAERKFLLERFNAVTNRMKAILDRDEAAARAIEQAEAEFAAEAGAPA